MADADPRVAQAVDPEVVADLTRLLQIRGPLGVLNVLDTIVPVVSLGDVVTRTVRIEQPVFRSTDVFSAGEQVAPGALTILADTAGLAAGLYDMQLFMTTTESAIANTFLVQHRNAANAANLMEFGFSMRSDGQKFFFLNPFAYEFAENERFRVLNRLTGAVGDLWNAIIFARRRT